jgi:hypothetical protein
MLDKNLLAHGIATDQEVETLLNLTEKLAQDGGNPPNAKLLFHPKRK